MTSISMSVVLFNNKTHDIERLVENLLYVTRDFPKTDLYLINNSPSNVRMSECLNQYKRRNNVHVIVSLSNAGFGSGNNLVLSEITSDYHFVINPDISIENPDQINKMIMFMNNNRQYGLLSPLIKFPNGEVQHLLKKKSTVFDMALRFVNIPFFKKRKENFISLPYGYTYTHEAENVPGSFMVFRTPIFKEIGGFDEDYFLYMEDSDITMKINQISKTVFYANAFVYHEWQRENRKSLRGVVIMLKSMFKYFNKWGWTIW